MAKAKAKKQTKEEPAKAGEPLDLKRVHELFSIPGPYEPPPPPIPTKGYVTWWDCGMSIATLAKKKPELFYIPRLFEGERCAKDTESWRRRMWGEPIEAGFPFADQEKKLKTGDQPAAAREIVMYLALVFLTTGEKLDLGRLRTKDKAENGQRMTVWFSPSGFDIASVSDQWKSPGIGLSVVCTPAVARKK